MIKFLILVFLIPVSLYAQRTPRSEFGFETGIDFRLIKKQRRFIFLAESRNRKELKSTDYHQLLLGSYYRLTKRFRMGVFLQAEQGLRWDEDWRRIDGQWKWQKVESRWDFASVLDATYADKINSKLLWEMKSRAYYFHSREKLQLRLRPGLRYFVLKHGRPLWQIYSEVESYIPVNYGDHFLYEYWAYLGALYQWSDRFSMGPVLSFRERWFHDYEDFKDRTGEDYRSKFQSTYIGLSAVYAW
ncbi:MAG: hypothetical protein ACLGHN_01280 [Bacteriovoracia bacterium]